jgi:hypothetical protein
MCILSRVSLVNSDHIYTKYDFFHDLKLYIISLKKDLKLNSYQRITVSLTFLCLLITGGEGSEVVDVERAHRGGDSAEDVPDV